MTQKTKNGFFNYCKVFHFCHKAINRFYEGIQYFFISNFIMAKQMHEPGIALKIGTEACLVVIYNLMEVINCNIIFTCAKIKRSEFIIENTDTMAINK